MMQRDTLNSWRNVAGDMNGQVGNVKIIKITGDFEMVGVNEDEELMLVKFVQTELAV